MGYYKYVKEIYSGVRNKLTNPENKDFRQMQIERRKEWRRGLSVVRVEKPTRIDKARQYGYKAKQGIVVARVRVRKGGMRKSRPLRGRSPKRQGVNKITPRKSIQSIGEERAQRRFMNLEVLGSYWLWEDGQFRWYEVILADPSHPSIQSDGDLSWVTGKQHRHRVFRGLSPAGKKSRGLNKKGRGAERVRPSTAAHDGKAK
jgi:large subunit ribosomal protein L15e